MAGAEVLVGGEVLPAEVGKDQILLGWERGFLISQSGIWIVSLCSGKLWKVLT